MFGQPEWHPSHTEFQRECLVELDSALGQLGIRLVTRRGEAVAMLEHVRRETGFTLLVAHEETGTGVTYARDRRVRRWAREAGVEFLELPQTGVVRRLRSRNGWNRLWEKRMEAACATLPRSTGTGGLATVLRLDSAGLLTSRDLGQPPDTKDRQRGGAVAAKAVLDDFLFRRGRHSTGGISSPLSAAASCSWLSPFLAFGAVSMRSVWQESEARRPPPRPPLSRLRAGDQLVTAADAKRHDGHQHAPDLQSLDAAGGKAGRAAPTPDPQQRLPFVGFEFSD